MKSYSLFLFWMLISIASNGQGFSYQSIVRNASGDPQAGITVFLRFHILEGSAAGPVLYSESQSPTTDPYGWISVQVGEGQPLFGQIGDVDWNSGPKFLQVECGETADGPFNELANSQINYSAFRGPKGDQGEKGDPGAPGQQGPEGPQGPQGDPGDGIAIVGTVPDESSLVENYMGAPGDIVITEDTGTGFVWNGDEWISIGQIQGPQGPQGEQGPSGPQGPQGIAGEDGEDGEVGPQGPPGETGPQGDPGPEGPQGDPGPPNSLSIGTVTEGPTAGASITGNPPNQVLNLTLPEGPAGPQGPQGPQGPEGPQGPPGPAGTYIAGTGINISGDVISAQNTTALWNANQLQGRNVSAGSPTQGFVLKWFPFNTQQWEAAPDNDSNPWSVISGGIQYQGTQVLTNEIRIGGSNWGLIRAFNGAMILGYNSIEKVGLYTSGGEWGPTVNNNVKLGSSSYRWSEIWCTNGLNQSSDARLKKDIVPVSGSLDRIMKMNPVYYHWKQDDGETHIGFLAQELEKVLPEVVRKPAPESNDETRSKDPSADAYAVNYSEIIPILVNAIQEQQKLIAELQAKVNQLSKD